MKYQVKWAGHVTRMLDECIPKQLFSGELSTGKCSHGGQCKWFRDTLKSSLETLDIDHTSWEHVTLNHMFWHSLINKGVLVTEKKHMAKVERKWHWCKNEWKVQNCRLLPHLPHMWETAHARIGLIIPLWITHGLANTLLGMPVILITCDGCTHMHKEGPLQSPYREGALYRCTYTHFSLFSCRYGDASQNQFRNWSLQRP